MTGVQTCALPISSAVFAWHVLPAGFVHGGLLALVAAAAASAKRPDAPWRRVLTVLGIGWLAGMFGLGAGWANVPALNLMMGLPLKVAAGTSSLILSMSSSAAWIYIDEGAILPLIAAPSIIGMMLGAFIGSRVLAVVNAKAIRRLVIVILLFAALRALEKGLGL